MLALRCSNLSLIVALVGRVLTIDILYMRVIGLLNTDNASAFRRFMARKNGEGAMHSGAIIVFYGVDNTINNTSG